MKHTLELTDSMTTLRAGAGEIVLLTGNIGSGKSLWLHRLAGLTGLPKAVTVTLDGARTDKFTVRLLFDRWPCIWLGQTVAEELMFGLKTQPTPQQLEKMLADWDLSDLSLETGLQTLNRLQSLRLSLAAMSLAEPALMLLDNPTAALSQEDAHNLIEGIANRVGLSNTIVVVACNRWHDWRSSVSQVWQITAPDTLPQAGIQI